MVLATSTTPNPSGTDEERVDPPDPRALEDALHNMAFEGVRHLESVGPHPYDVQLELGFEPVEKGAGCGGTGSGRSDGLVQYVSHDLFPGIDIIL